MSDTPTPPDEDRARRNRLLGRIAIVGLGLLVLIQIAPLLLHWAQGHPF